MTLAFHDICSLLEGVENISNRRPELSAKEVKERVHKKVDKWFGDHRQALDNPETNACAILSALFPHRRKDRVYGLQSLLLSKKIVRLLNLNHGKRALFGTWSTGSGGDLGKYTELVMRSWDGTFRRKDPILIERVDNLLTQMAAKYRFSDPAVQAQRDRHVSTDTELANILRHLASWEAKWLIRLILREYTTIDLDEVYVLERYHFLLPDLLKFQNDFNAAFAMLRGEFKAFPSAPDVSLRRSLRLAASSRLRAVVGVKVARPTFYKAWSFKHCFQLLGNQSWAAEVKYDGEYCEIHIDLDNIPGDIKIFSKNGKDATADRQLLHSTIRSALRMGQPTCFFKRKCVVLAEMVLYSDREKRILPFSKIRKHVSRSGTFLGTLQDSLPHKWEHMMLVFFDILVLDDDPILRKSLQGRRQALRDLIQIIPGRSQRSEWTSIDFRFKDGITDLKQAFARTLASHQEGLILKPVNAPYFPIMFEIGQHQPGFYIKLKKDYLSDMGGARDLGDFAIIGACFDARVASKSNIKPLHWTHFYLGCAMNKPATKRGEAKLCFKIVGCLSLDKCIPGSELKHLNTHGPFQKVALSKDGCIDAFDLDHGPSYDRRMSVAFKKPFVAEVLGGGYEMVQNERFEMLRHPRIKKIHHDRTWEDTVTTDDLKRMAAQKWDYPKVDELTGHARDVAVLAERYGRELSGSQFSVSECETSQYTTPRTSQASAQHTPCHVIVPETQQATMQNTPTTTSSTQCSGSTQDVGLRASREIRILVREDTAEKSALAPMTPLQASVTVLPMERTTSVGNAHMASKKRSSSEEMVSPPASKRRRPRNPLQEAGGGRNIGAFDYDSQEKIIHIYAEDGWKVQVHAGPQSVE